MSGTIRPLLLFTFIALGVMTTPACAAQATYYRAPEAPVVDARAYDVGYREGFQLGRDDARRGRPSDYARHREYRRHSDERDDPAARRFQRLYRNGFATGYNDAYRQFVRWWR